MSEQLVSVLANLRRHIGVLSDAYQVGLTGESGTLRYNRRDNVRVRAVANAHARLAYLVPLYRALHAASQQTGHATGAQRYIKKFEALKNRMRESLRYEFDGNQERLFGGVAQGIPVLIPVAGVPPQAWRQASIGELFTEVMLQSAAETEDSRRLRREAEALRKRFLASLSDAQCSLLHQAMTAAQATGVYAVSFEVQDLVNVR